MNSEFKLSRRGFMASTAIAIGGTVPGVASANQPQNAEFEFEFVRSDSEWREALSKEDYFLLRQGGTEPPQSHPYWEKDNTEEGSYNCKGCGLPLYENYQKVVLDIGWVFFRHSYPYSVLTNIDRLTYGDVARSGEDLSTMAANAGMRQELTEEEIRALDSFAGVEAVCRRCGSHLGHIVSIDNKVLHCINGGSLEFVPEAA